MRCTNIRVNLYLKKIITPRASCHSLSCPFAVSSLIRARSKYKSPDARRLWITPTARQLMIRSPSQVQICVNQCKSASKKIRTRTRPPFTFLPLRRIFTHSRPLQVQNTGRAPIGMRRLRATP